MGFVMVIDEGFVWNSIIVVRHINLVKLHTK